MVNRKADRQADERTARGIVDEELSPVYDRPTDRPTDSNYLILPSGRVTLHIAYVGNGQRHEVRRGRTCDEAG